MLENSNPKKKKKKKQIVYLDPNSDEYQHVVNTLNLKLKSSEMLIKNGKNYEIIEYLIEEEIEDLESQIKKLEEDQT